MIEDQSFLVWTWILQNPLAAAPIFGAVIASVFWLAHANYKAFIKLIPLLIPPFVYVLIFIAVIFLAILGSNLSILSSNLSVEPKTVKFLQVWEIAEHQRDLVFSSYSSFQWITFSIAFAAFLAAVVSIATHIFKPDNQEPDV